MLLLFLCAFFFGGGGGKGRYFNGLKLVYGNTWSSHVFLQGMFLLQKVKIKLEGLRTRCKMQSSPCVFSSSSTSLLKIYQAYQLWISSTIKIHETKTSRLTALRNCQLKKLDFFFPNNLRIFHYATLFSERNTKQIFRVYSPIQECVSQNSIWRFL